MRRLAFLAIVGLISTSAFAQQPQKSRECVHAPTILAAADFLLTEPAKKPNIWRDRMGDDAAYLKIRYGNLAYAEGVQLLDTLQQRADPPQRILELRLAYAKTPDRMKLLATLSPTANEGSILARIGESAWHALVLEDGGDWMFDELARWRVAVEFGFDWSITHQKMAEALADLDDEAKSRLARRAENAGAWRLALTLLALKTNLSEYLSYLDRLPPPDWNGGLSEQERRERLIFDALDMNAFRLSFDISAQPAEVQAADRKRIGSKAFREIGRLATRAPDMTMLLTVQNSVVDLRVGTVVAATVDAQIEAGLLDPINKPEAVISEVITGLDLVLGRRDREEILGRFGLSGMQGETAGDFIDRSLARLAFASFMRGEAAAAPSRPAQITAAFAWERWLGLAGSLKAGEKTAPEDGIIAAELLIAANRPLDAVDTLKAASDWKIASPRAPTDADARQSMRRVSRPSDADLGAALSLRATLTKAICTAALRQPVQPLTPTSVRLQRQDNALTRGSRVYFPVYVKGGGLSMGDIHWSQGDGEITFCGAIEMAGWIDIGVGLIKGGVAKYGITNPVFKPSPVDPHFDDYLIFEGISVDEHTGEQYYLDAHVTYRRACLNAIEYLKKFGYSGEQAFMILGTAPVEGRIAGIVDIPNVCATVAIPTGIFDFDINPSASGPKRAVSKVEVARAS